MTDATQAFGKLSINVDKLGVDLLTFSGHKIYGPKGIGGLFVRGRRPNKVKLAANIHGGGHEKSMRSGTLNVPGIVGLGVASDLAKKQLSDDALKIGAMRDYLESELLKIENAYVNGDAKHRIYNVTNICFKGADADAIMVGLKDIMVSNGSACTSTKVEPSHVLKAMGKSDEDAYSSIRFSLGRFTTQGEILATVSKVKDVVQSLRLMVS
jgi:cysteine desulfurase